HSRCPIGVLISGLFRAMTGEKESEEVKRMKAATAAPGPQRAGQISFFRDRAGEPLQVEMDGKILGNAIELNGKQRQTLEELVLEVRTWLGYAPQQPAVTPPAAFSGEANAEPEYLPSSFTAEPAVRAPSAGTPAVATAPGEAKSIVAQIDEILQEHLAGSALASRSIRLMEVPKEGVIVAVGVDHYPDIDAVPDPDIRAIIQTAVAEWEQNNH
ncbi:MAG: hypothetical protein M1281_18095, partial [Chloroflexi bacterium]|nr:hypothetical protein [Chloroflexota bacterium]